jgi:hypothetical protein
VCRVPLVWNWMNRRQLPGVGNSAWKVRDSTSASG